MEKKSKITVSEYLPRPEKTEFPSDLLTAPNPLSDAIVDQFNKRFFNPEPITQNFNPTLSLRKVISAQEEK